MTRICLDLPMIEEAYAKQLLLTSSTYLTALALLSCGKRLPWAIFFIRQSWWPKWASRDIIWRWIRDKCEAISGESNSKLVVVSNETDRDMTPVSNDNSCKPASVKRLLKCKPTRMMHSWAVMKCKTWADAERFSLPKLAIIAWHNFRTCKKMQEYQLIILKPYLLSTKYFHKFTRQMEEKSGFFIKHFHKFTRGKKVLE